MTIEQVGIAAVAVIALKTVGDMALTIRALVRRRGGEEGADPHVLRELAQLTACIHELRDVLNRFVAATRERLAVLEDRAGIPRPVVGRGHEDG